MVLKGSLAWDCVAYRGTYCGAVDADGRPDGSGDFDGEGDDEGRAYKGEWRGGRPCRTGWRRYPWGAVYAGEARDPAVGWRSGRGTLWSADGRRCFDGEWDFDTPIGDGLMLLENGELQLVRFDSGVPPAALADPDGSVWTAAARVATLGLVEDGWPPVAAREGRGRVPEWDATMRLPDGRTALWRMRGLTQVPAHINAVELWVRSCARARARVGVSPLCGVCGWRQ